MFQHEVKLRVRYADTDQMGFVYYGNYAAFYEVARVESFRNLGFSYKNLESNGVGMPVLHMQSSYHAPARYDDLRKIIIKIPEMPRARIRYEYEIYNEEAQLLNTGETTLAFINMSNGRPVKMPENLKALISTYFKN
jgi:acyl-CoA thioester hydrolase